MPGRRYIVLTILAFCVAVIASASRLPHQVSEKPEYLALADSADRYMEHENWQDAVRVLEKALRIDPANSSNWLLWSNLGTARENLGDYEAALQAFEIGLARAPKSTVLLVNRARSLMALGQYKRAEESFDAALEADPRLPWPIKMKGLLRLAEGDLDEAESLFGVYEVLNGEDPVVEDALGDISLCRGNSSIALLHLKKAWSLEKSEDRAVKLLLNAASFGMIEDYQNDLTEALSLWPRNANLYLVRAQFNGERYQTQAMEKDLATARSLGASAEDLKKFSVVLHR